MRFEDAHEKAKAIYAEAKTEAAKFNHGFEVDSDYIRYEMDGSFIEGFLTVRIAKLILESENDHYKGLYTKHKPLIEKGLKYDKLVDIFKDNAHRFDVADWLKIKAITDGKI